MRARWTGMRCSPSWAARGRKYRYSVYAAWGAREPFTAPIRTPVNRPSWRGTNWHFTISEASSICCGMTISSPRCNEKGGVEGEGGFFRRNHLTPVPEARDYAHLNELLREASQQDESRVVG